MKSLLVAFLLPAVLFGSVEAQSKSSQRVLSVCEVLRSVKDFSGKIVTVSGDVPSPRALQLYDTACGRISLTYSEDADVSPRPRFKTVRDEEFKKFEGSLSVLVPPPPSRPARVTIVVEGRFDAASLMRKSGFGHMGVFDYRLVIRRITKVEVQHATSEGLR